MKTIGILGAGAWGTALAMAAHRAGLQVTLQAFEADVADDINTHHENSTYLPGAKLDPSIVATVSIEQAVQADAVILVSPAQFLRQTCEAAKAHWVQGTPAIICAKGIEQGSYKLLSEVVEESLGDLAPRAILSGPTFAIEVAHERPTALTLACTDEALGQRLSKALSSRCFRTYYSADVIGAQLGGAVKNVMAIACGIIEGRGMGDNARAALITRGLAEISRMGAVLGADEHTLMGLSGLGDLSLTCSAMQSRNFSLGVALGQGQSLASILQERKSVTEGVYTAAAVTELARRLQVDMPICLAVDAILNLGADLDSIIDGLLRRPLNVE
ncbi:MAG: NAD(P)-dependent glycerol-3-phosphate dehydrogenase [Magnetovibrio sp.]|nr:NAD(P)-dependent glycerol-3-phosphate dehydrogenase [Magnetovibrio sp.]